MNEDGYDAKWKEFHGETPTWGGKLTADDLDWAARRFDVIAGLLREEHDLARRGSGKKIDQRMTDYEFKLKKENASTLQ